ncbi:hypothetical protein BU24DRAFT_422433 [Aaosphaeria arxii CBS 175.79]|uniref:Uncharacterized protein n=1 Tax=Aaosphaeria arxii CBS 175.79 TaxID=1450172 RepID=A0A6A5XTE9_9PLEO|nr:uncharacterized protein BU24DRAFT_422433 [Aaosphaeria arxii CBS 175.79]KAF2016097.1 hypothetical protein BU24DRAFT_422433 [Aaosphaeria arxii CBS 175.79]
MSAPNPVGGRQSPEPERQTGAQQQDPPASKPNQAGTETNESSADQRANLSSNPTHPLAEHAAETTSKK